MRILVCGSNGQVGHELVARAAGFGLEATGLSRKELDISQPEQVANALQQFQPGLIINAAAYTRVDNAETEVERAYAINRDACGILADAASLARIPLLHISTDYVFAGDGNVPYRETDMAVPSGVYGASKRAGELEIQARLGEHLILRTSWVYGAHGNNFVKTMLRLGSQRNALSVVADQFGCPTHAGSIAEVLLELSTRYATSGRLAWGLYHYSGVPPCSWHGFAVEIFRQAQQKGLLARCPQVHPINTAQYPTPARRPAWSVLDCSLIEKTFGIAARDWHGELSRMLDELKDVHPSLQVAG